MNIQKFTTFKTILIALVLTINANQLFAQTTNGIFFQAVARDNFSNPAKDRKIYVQSSIIQTTPTGTKVLTEEHQANTDATGVFSISLGNGIRVGGTATSLATIDWSKGPFYLNLKVAITPIGGNSNWDYSKEWVDMGTTSFGAVPFALYSASSAKVDDKLNVSDTTTMLKVYAKAMSIKTLETSLATKLTAADTLTMLAPYAKAAYTIDSSFFKSQLATKLSLSDSAKYVTPTQLAAKTFDQTPITNAIATKLNITDTIYYTKQKFTDSAFAKKLNIADSAIYVTKTQLANFNFSSGGGSSIDTSSLSSRINLKANAFDITTLNTSISSNTASITSNATAINAEATRARAAELVLTNNVAANTASITANTSSIAIFNTNVASNTSSITANATAIAAEAARATAAELILTNNVSSNTSSITSNTAAVATEATTARAAELLISNSVATQTTAIATKLNITDTSYLLKKTDTASLSSRINLKLNASQLGIANGVASLNASGIIPSSQLPPVSLSSTSVVASDADMTALSATVGSIAIRTDLNKNYVLSTLPASTLSNWVELLTPAAPVQAVNGYTGSVNLAKSDISLSDVDNTSDISKPVSNATQAALNTKIDANKVGVASGLASLNALGKIPTDQIPAISFSSVKVLSSQVDMLALSSAVVGSVVIRTDENKNYVLAQTNPAVLSNWIQLLTPAPPVQTVNGYSGNVSIAKSDLGLGNIDNTSDANKPISAATLSSLNSKANTSDVTALLALKSPLASPNFTGTPTAPTATIGTNSTQLATTAFVNNTTTNINASSISGTIAVSKGGTGQTTIAGIQTALGLAGSKVAIGGNAGQTSQGANAVSIGSDAGKTSQGQYAVALGGAAGTSTQGTGAIAIGYAAGQTSQGTNSVAIGSNAAQLGQGTQSVAIGYAANSTGNNAIGIGVYSSATGNNSTAIGYKAETTAANTIQLGGDGVVTGSTAITNVKTTGTLTAGTVTYPNAHNATAGQLLSINATGTATWATPASSGGTHAIGEVYGGGIVFYIWDGGAHGLIAATANLTGKYWGADGTQVNSSVYPLRDGIGAGRNNTERIIQNIKSSDNIFKSDYTSYAAYVCLTFQDGNYGDWYLPSKYELYLLYLQKTLLSMSGMYWSSNDGATRDAWCYNFDAGTTYLNTKNYFQMNARPIRIF